MEWVHGEHTPDWGHIIDLLAAAGVGSKERSSGMIGLLEAIGVRVVRPKSLSGTMGGFDLDSSEVQVMDTVWSTGGLELGGAIIHEATHFWQARDTRWGGLGLEVMATTVEWVYQMLLNGKVSQDVKNRLGMYMDRILAEEIELMERRMKDART